MRKCRIDKIVDLKKRNQISHYNNAFYATMCHVCKRFGDGIHLKRCGGCNMIAYCGRQHQKEHWKQHKPLCKAIQDVLQNRSIDDHAISFLCSPYLEHWQKKMNFARLVSNKLGRLLTLEELQVVYHRRECLVCHEENTQSLEDCQKCAGSFCKSHKDGIEHRDMCAPLELCVLSDLLNIREESYDIDLRPYLNRVFYTGAYQNIRVFIKAFGNIRTDLEVSYNIKEARHSFFLSRPLTLFHAMRLLNFAPKNKDLVIHVVGASDAEEATLMAWEVLPRLVETVMSVAIIMIGPQLKHRFNPSHICDKCKLRKKKCLMFEFHDVLYENYVRSPLFVNPDLVVGFNLGVHARELGSKEETWAPSIQMLAKQNCPFALTCYVRREIKLETDRISTILGRKVDYLYSDKNPFSSLRPMRAFGPEHIFYQNQYLLIYRSLCS